MRGSLHLAYNGLVSLAYKVIDVRTTVNQQKTRYHAPICENESQQRSREINRNFFKTDIIIVSLQMSQASVRNLERDDQRERHGHVLQQIIGQ